MNELDGIRFKVEGKEFKVKKETECGLYIIETEDPEIDNLQRENLRTVLQSQKYKALGKHKKVIQLNKAIYEHSVALANYFHSYGLYMIAKSYLIAACDSAIQSGMFEKAMEILAVLKNFKELTKRDWQHIVALEKKLHFAIMYAKKSI